MANFYQHKTALVTGASAGIGRAVANKLIQQGTHVIGVARNREKLEQIKEGLSEEQKKRFEIVISDLSSSTGVDYLLDQFESSGRNKQVDILINNAGVGYRGNFTHADSATYQSMMDLNMSALTRLTRFFAEPMIEHHSGAILNVASMAGLTPVPNFAVYAATKSFVISFSEALHYELKTAGISVTVVNPGPTRTDFFSNAGMQPPAVFSRRMNTPENVAKKALEGLEKNKLQVFPGWSEKILHKINSISPKKISIPVSGRMMKSEM